MKGYNYTIKAIPTTFDGVNYRSRLEARWGAFFTILGWDFVYEPVDLNGWAPDFMIRGPAGQTLIEVKPEINADTILAFRRAAPPNARSILVGCAPLFESGGDLTAIGLGWGDGTIGFLDYMDCEPTTITDLERITMGRCDGRLRRGCGIGMCPNDGAWTCWRCGADGLPYDDGVISGLWKRACNLTKWGR